MLHGDEDARAVITTGVKQKVQEFLPGRKDPSMSARSSSVPPRVAALGRRIRRPGAARRAHRSLRTDPGRPRRRGRDRHDRRDLHLARQRQLREQDDVVADRRRPHAASRPASRPCSAGGRPRRCSRSRPLLVIANGAQGTFLHLRGIRRKPGGLSNLRYNIEMGPPAFAPRSGQPGRRHGLAGLAAAPGGRLNAVPHPSATGGHPRRQGAFPGLRRPRRGRPLGRCDRRRGPRPPRPAA